jgi:hypothetical protein
MIEFWQLTNVASPTVPRGSAASDIRVFAARGTQPTLQTDSDNHFKVVPPIRDPDTGRGLGQQ